MLKRRGLGLSLSEEFEEGNSDEDEEEAVMGVDLKDGVCDGGGALK